MATTRPPLVVHEHLPDQPAPPGWTARDGFDLPARPWDLGARRWVCVGAVDDAGTADAALDALARGVGLAITIGLEGDARRRLLDDLHRLVVVHDEMDLPPGKLKVKVGGGLAGNNGLKSIKAHLKSDDFVRVRVGIGKPPGRQEGVDHVLRRPGKAEKADLAIAMQEAADAVEAILAEGAEAAQTRYNQRT